MYNLMWQVRILEAFNFIQEFERKPVLAFGNGVLVVGMPEPLYWIANNDNKAKS